MTIFLRILLEYLNTRAGITKKNILGLVQT